MKLLLDGRPFDTEVKKVTVGRLEWGDSLAVEFVDGRVGEICGSTGSHNCMLIVSAVSVGGQSAKPLFYDSADKITLEE